VDYQPRPIDTRAVSLPEELHDLVELLAESAHDQWALLRFSQGWIFGPERDDALKRHPCLVPYSELPDSEREYDRRTAIETLKAVVALGYELRRRP